MIENITLKRHLLQSFLSEQGVGPADIPLFAENKGFVEIFKYGKNDRLVLKRSEEMEAAVIDEVTKVILDYDAATERYDGLIYLMYTRAAETIIPLYIGKSEKKGKTDNLSTNIRSIHSNSSKFCRWGYNYAYHIGDLSAAACIGHPTQYINEKSVAPSIRPKQTLYKEY
jgi:hypothetical protein